jgi:diguanylate cyclase (GGDEF)-like protein/PAS domain S-box-containing protein
LVTALFSCLNLASIGFMPWSGVASGVLGFWTGDMIGVLTLTPAILVGANLPLNRRIDFPWGFVPPTRGFLIIEASLVLMFVAGAHAWTGDDGGPLRWYPFFLPIISISLRFGIAGAAAGTLVVNTVVAILVAATAAPAVAEGVQGLLIMLSVAGLLIGSVVSELSTERAGLDRRVHDRTAELRNEVERRRAAEERALRERDRAETYLSIAKALIVALDRQGRITLMNGEGRAVLGYDDEDVIGRDWFDLAVPLVARARARAQHDELFDERRPSSARYQATIVTRTGERRTIEWRIRVIQAEGDGAAAGSLSSGIDITERVRAEREMRYLATHDGTTGLRNRHWLRDHLDAAIARATRRATLLALLFMDLDGFKRINDEFGHDAGDMLLGEVARRLRACVREADGVIRFGGDEFVVVLEELSDPADGSNVAEKSLCALSHPIVLNATSVGIGVSIGIAFYPRDGTTVESLLHSADGAMYLAKKNGRNCWRFAADPSRAARHRRGC